MKYLDRKFTLIELLVVISIIALLISILLPALSKAKKVAQDVKCKSNLHGTAIAWCSYNSENNGRLPFVLKSDYPATGNRVIWVTLMRDQLNDKAVNRYSREIDYGSFTVSMSGTLLCPSQQIREADILGATSRHKGRYLHYGMNNRLTKIQLETDISQSSEMMIIGDNWSNSTGVTGWYYWNQGVNANWAFRHSSGKNLNTSFADGHVDAMQYDMLTGSANAVPWLSQFDKN